MNLPIVNKSIPVVAIALLFFTVSCEKSYKVAVLPIEVYQYKLYDSVEGVTNSSHYSLNRVIEFDYDPNLDKCYMPNHKLYPVQTDTFDRHHFWKRGYMNRRDMHHRIIFNGDTITIHHKLENTIGEGGFRYTHGIKL